MLAKAYILPPETWQKNDIQTYAARCHSLPITSSPLKHGNMVKYYYLKQRECGDLYMYMILFGFVIKESLYNFIWRNKAHYLNKEFISNDKEVLTLSTLNNIFKWIG